MRLGKPNPVACATALIACIATELTENYAQETAFPFNGMEVDEQPNRDRHTSLFC
jgi:hypothetical protein